MNSLGKSILGAEIVRDRKVPSAADHHGPLRAAFLPHFWPKRHARRNLFEPSSRPPAVPYENGMLVSRGTSRHFSLHIKGEIVSFPESIQPSVTRPYIIREMPVAASGRWSNYDPPVGLRHVDKEPISISSTPSNRPIVKPCSIYFFYCHDDRFIDVIDLQRSIDSRAIE